MARTIILLFSLLTLSIRVNTQFYDIFQSFQPYIQSSPTTKTYDFFADFGLKPKTETINRRYEEDQTVRKRPTASVASVVKDRTTVKPRRKIQTNIETTTVKYVRKTNKNTAQRNAESNKKRNQALSSRRQTYDDTANNVDYTERSTRRSIASQSTRPEYNGYNNGFSSFAQRPGVKPAPVDTNRPPITNRPPTSRPFAVYPIVTDSSAIRYPEDPDTSPELVMGPDEDKMSYAERRRYISLVEKMCDKYKSFNVQSVEAIPLVPSPEPVRVRVPTCAPATSPLVVGGRVASVEEFPHMALLGWTHIKGGGYSWKCGGSLISDQYVLTAGHCATQEKDDTVVTGAPRVVQLGSSYMDDTGALVVKVLSVIRHPKYARPKSYYDIALVKLVKPVTFSKVIKPACLGDAPDVGEPVIVTGWGRTEYSGSQSLELRSVSVPIWDMDECREVLGVSRKMPDGPSRDSQVCAGEKQGGKDACQGDSGGPAQTQDGCVWRVVAVTSIGRSCGAPNTPGLYARVHKAFIGAQIFGNNPPSTNENRNNNNNNNPSQQNNRQQNNQGNRNNNNNDQQYNSQTNWNNNGQSNNGNRNNQGSWNGNNDQNNRDTTWNNNKPDSDGQYSNNNQNNWNVNQQTSNGNRNNNNYQGSRNISSRPNRNNNNQNSWGTYSQTTENNNRNGWDVNSQQSGNYEQTTRRWIQNDYNNGNNWNDESQSNGNRNNNNGFYNNPGVDNTNYNTGSVSNSDYGNNRGGYDDYYNGNRQQRNNNYREITTTTKRPTFSWPNFGF